MLPIRSEQCQNTKFSWSKHWKWPRLADDKKFHQRLKRISKPKHTRLKLSLKSWRIPMCFQHPSYERREVCTSHHHEQRRYRHRFNDHHLQHSCDWNSQWDPWQTSSEEKKKKKTGILQKFLIPATKGQNWERKDLNLKDLRNIRKWTTRSRRA